MEGPSWECNSGIKADLPIACCQLPIGYCLLPIDYICGSKNICTCRCLIRIKEKERKARKISPRAKALNSFRNLPPRHKEERARRNRIRLEEAEEAKPLVFSVSGSPLHDQFEISFSYCNERCSSDTFEHIYFTIQ